MKIDKIKKLVRLSGSAWWYSLGIFVASLAGAIFNLYTGMVYLPSRLSVGDLGAIEPVTRLASFGAIPLGVIGQVAVKYLSTYDAKGARGKIKRFIWDMGLIAVVLSAAFTWLLVLSYESFSIRLGLQGVRYVLPCLIGLMIVSCWQPLLNVVLQGMRRFWITICNSVLQPMILLLLTLLLVPFGQLGGVLAARFFSALIPIGVGLYALRRYMDRSVISESYYDEWAEILRFGWPLLLMALVSWLQGFVEPFVIRHRLSAMDSAGYYMASRWGYIPSYLVASISFVILPIFSHRHEKGESTERLFFQALGVTGVVGCTGILFMALAAGWIFTLLPAWQQYAAYSPFVWQVGVIVVLQALIATYQIHEVARRRFGFMWLCVPIMLLETFVLYGSFGWVAFRPYLYEALWVRMDALIPSTLGYAVGLMIWFRVAIAAALTGHWLASRRLRPSDVPVFHGGVAP